MAHEDIIELINQQDEISDDAAEAIIEALAQKVPLDVERDEPGRLTGSSGAGERIHTHVSSLTSSDAWTCFLWLEDAAAALGHIPAHMACLRETFAHSLGQAYLERALEMQRAQAIAARAATLEVDEQPGSSSEEPRE